MLVDHLRLKQVLINLLSNAVKYNKKGGFVRLETCKVEDNFLRLSVSDNGLGISKEKQKALFEPFNRLGREALEIEGTGLGLSIVKQLVEMMSGNLGFTSQEDEGSTFWVEVPLSEKQKTVPKNDNDVIVGLGPRASNDSDDVGRVMSLREDDTTCVLYVEDNPANVMLMKAIFREISHITLVCVNTAEKGLAAAKEHPIDLILMDLNLPGMSGFSAREILKRDPGTCHIPIIAISADVTKSTLRKVRELGFETFISKPIDVAKTKTTIIDSLQ